MSSISRCAVRRRACISDATRLRTAHSFEKACSPCSLSYSVQGIKFTDNVVADPDLASACTDATLLVFVLPHQFLGKICPQMTTMAPGCRCISLIKGIEFSDAGQK